MLPIPLQVIDGFFIKISVGDALLAGYALGLLAVLPFKSKKVVSAHTILFGLLFVILPNSMFTTQELSLLNSALQYKLVGLVLLSVSPVLFATAKE